MKKMLGIDQFTKIVELIELSAFLLCCMFTQCCTVGFALGVGWGRGCSGLGRGLRA